MLPIDDLLDPAAFSHPAPHPRLEETHISWVILAGEHAYKIKKPVRLPFLDYSTRQARRRYCEAEVTLNRRLAPELYLGLARIAATSQGLRVVTDGDGADGDIVDYAVRMRRFPSEARLDRILERGELSAELVDAAARRIARMHAEAPRAPPDSPWGGLAANQAPVQDSLDALADAAPAVREARRWTAEAATGLAATFTRRLAEGFVREVHGDLHLANLVRIGDEVVPFDAIEFDPNLRWIDIQADAAFLVMDLASRERPDLAWRFYDEWLARTGDYDGVALLRWYLVYRHLVRAKVDRIRLAQLTDDPAESARLKQRLAVHLGAIRDLARPGRPGLFLTHGLSASGKSTVARALTAQFPMVRLRSDLIRKRLAGLDPFADHARRPPGLYTEAWTERVYAELRRLAGLALDAGWHTIVDATCLTAARRAPLWEVAAERGLPAVCLHCRAPAAELEQRIVARASAGKDPSDADLAVLAAQRQIAEGPAVAERDNWLTLDTTEDPDTQSLARALRHRMWA